MLLPTTLLRHETPGTPGSPPAPCGPHYDWLIVPPSSRLDPQGRLWTARAQRHWDQWEPTGTLLLTALPPHRRRYLTWEGALTDDRGHVFNAGRGQIQTHLWAHGRIELTLRRPAGPPLPLRLERLDADRWRAVARH